MTLIYILVAVAVLACLGGAVIAFSRVSGKSKMEDKNSNNAMMTLVVMSFSLITLAMMLIPLLEDPRAITGL